MTQPNRSNQTDQSLQKEGRLPPDLEVGFAPDWGYFIRRGRDRVTEFSHTREDALRRYVEKGEDRPKST